MTDGQKTIIAMFGAIILCSIIAAIIASFTGCKPSLPQRDEYPGQLYPCYIADVCVRMSAYTEGAKQDCAVALQKCFRYTDYDKCRDADKPEKCWEWLGVRY